MPADTYTYYSYDPRGNTTQVKDLSAGTTYFESNDRDLPESIHYPGGAVNYFHYDARGRRYAMEDSSGLTYFTWDENGMNVLCERDATGAVTKKYTHGPTPVDGIGSVVEIEDTAAAAFNPKTSGFAAIFGTLGQFSAFWPSFGPGISLTEYFAPPRRKYRPSRATIAQARAISGFFAHTFPAGPCKNLLFW